MATLLSRTFFPWRRSGDTDTPDEAVMLRRLRSATLRAQQSGQNAACSHSTAHPILDTLARLDQRRVQHSVVSTDARASAANTWSTWPSVPVGNTLRSSRRVPDWYSRIRPVLLPRRAQMHCVTATSTRAPLPPLPPELWRAVLRAARQRRQQPDAVLVEALHRWLVTAEAEPKRDLFQQAQRQVVWGRIEETLSQLRAG